MALSSTTLSIASIRYSLSCPGSMDMGSMEDCYDPFRDIGCERQEALDIDIRIELGRAPCTGSERTVFDTGESWVLSTDDDHYYLALNPRHFSGQGLWTAQIARDMTQATVYCSEKMVTRTEQGITISNPVRYPLDQILLMHILARHEGLLVHAAGVSIEGKALIFPGKSGAGKSTLSRLLEGEQDMALLSDDRIAVRRIGEGFMAYGTPWPGDQGAALNQKAALGGMCFLRHADTDKIVPLTPSQALERLFPVASIPWYDKDVLPAVLQFCDDLISNVPAYELHFRPGAPVVALVRDLY